jgi:hypothetical protein
MTVSRVTGGISFSLLLRFDMGLTLFEELTEQQFNPVEFVIHELAVLVISNDNGEKIP